MSSEKPAVDLAAARKKLAGLPSRRLDGDWLAVDAAGHVAFFAGNERGPVPLAADRVRVSDALEAIARAARDRQSATALAETNDAYRGFAGHAQEPVFDAPFSSRGKPMHETPLEGYPLLVVAADAVKVRELAVEWTAREVVARDAFAAIFPVIGRASYDELHDGGACAGCRVLDDPADPRARAPEALAAAGLYVYAHVDEAASEPYRRVAGPTIAADLVDLEPVVQMVASLVKLPVRFEEVDWLTPATLVPCGD